jgi:hypothetical protein
MLSERWHGVRNSQSRRSRAPDSFRGEMARLFDVMDCAPPLHHDLIELDAPVWGEGRVLLPGDAGSLG